MNFSFPILIPFDYQSLVQENKHFKLYVFFIMYMFYVIIIFIISRCKDTNLFSGDQIYFAER